MGKKEKKKHSNKIQDYRRLLSNTNMQSFMLLIKNGEGTMGVNSYRTLVGGDLFNGFERHPNIYNPKLTSTAAGAYQFRDTTWVEDQKALKLKDFSPASQDVAALYEIEKDGAVADILNGRIEAAINKTKGTWRSLPGAKHDAINRYSQKLGDALEFYRINGGAINGPGHRNVRNYAEAVTPVDSLTVKVVDYIKRMPQWNKPSSIKPFISPYRIIPNQQNYGTGSNIPVSPLWRWISNGFGVVPVRMEAIDKGGSIKVTKLAEDKGVQPNSMDGNTKGADLPRANRQLSAPDPGNSNPLMNYPELKKKWSPGLYDQNRFWNNLFSTGTNESKGQNMHSQALSFEIMLNGNGGKYDPLDGRNIPPLPLAGNESPGSSRSYRKKEKEANESRTVNINLNTPMIGHFTITAKDTTAAINNLKYRVEEALLEILYNAVH